MSAIVRVAGTLGRLFSLGAIVGLSLLRPSLALTPQAAVPSLASARPATGAELRVFARFAPAPRGWKIDEHAVAGRFALLEFYGPDSAVSALLEREATGAWTLVTQTAGQLTPAEMIRRAPRMRIFIAQCLYDLARSQGHP